MCNLGQTDKQTDKQTNQQNENITSFFRGGNNHQPAAYTHYAYNLQRQFKNQNEKRNAYLLVAENSLNTMKLI